MPGMVKMLWSLFSSFFRHLCGKYDLYFPTSMQFTSARVFFFFYSCTIYCNVCCQPDVQTRKNGGWGSHETHHVVNYLCHFLVYSSLWEASSRLPVNNRVFMQTKYLILPPILSNQSSDFTVYAFISLLHTADVFTYRVQMWSHSDSIVGV